MQKKPFFLITILLVIVLGLTGGVLWKSKTIKTNLLGYLPYEMINLAEDLLWYISSRLKSGYFMVQMRDGVKLRTKVWKPSGGGRYPVVLERGYRVGRKKHAQAFTKAGYVYIGQQTRGNLQDNMFFPDAKDGYDCLDWISKQPWCDGKIAMYGRSFYGATQWLVAPEQHPNLKAIIPQNINPNPWERMYWDHGALQLAHTARRIYHVGGKGKVKKYGGWAKFHQYLPLINLDEAIGAKNQLWKKYVTHSTYDNFWKSISLRGKYNKIKIPVYIMGGWYDNYPDAAFNSFTNVRKNTPNNKTHIIINPSDHDNKIVGDRNFGDNAHKYELQLAIRWLNYIIKNINDGIADEPPIKIFVMGINEWRGEWEWPLARTLYSKYYLRGNDSKNGVLSTEPPGDELTSSYTYNPENPVPTLGGNHSSPYIPGVIRVGAVDQRPIETRQDVLVFTSDQLKKDVEVTGPITMKLFAATSARDTDFICRLIDVYPDGTAYNLTEGIIRARFRNSIHEPPKLVEPGEIYEYNIELQPTSNVFQKGHKLRLHLTSSSFPLWDRNPNTGHVQGMDSVLQAAYQTIYHDTEHPSHIILPIIPD
jgi:putative CocE/NonD family hydrolase